MSAVRNAEAKRVTSIARAINWSYMWRRLMSYVWLDLLLMVIAAAILVYGYNQTLPDGAFTAGWIPGATVHGMSLTPARGWDPTTLTYAVELARTTKTFPLAQDLVALWPLYIVVVGWQVIGVLNMLGGARRVRRTMAPLNDLALRVDELGRMQLSGGKMETLEQAIERASVDSPSVTTGDADLASIEVALNRLLRQMQEAKLQQMRFVNDASHELRTPIAVIQGYVNMLDRWGKDDPAVLAESIASLKAESEHMQELVEQLLFLARGDAGRTVLRRANTNLAALVGEVCEESQMIDAGHTYRLAYDTALALANHYIYEKSIDTIICMDGSEVIGAFLARQLTQKILFSVNNNKSICVVTPEYDSNGQLLFRENLVPMIHGRNMLLLISTVWNASNTMAAKFRALRRFSARSPIWTASRY